MPISDIGLKTLDIIKRFVFFNFAFTSMARKKSFGTYEVFWFMRSVDKCKYKYHMQIY